MITERQTHSPADGRTDSNIDQLLQNIVIDSEDFKRSIPGNKYLDTRNFRGTPYFPYSGSKKGNGFFFFWRKLKFKLMYNKKFTLTF